MIYEIKNARKARDDGYIYHQVAGEDDKIYLTIRAGLSWPEDTAPAYYCILAEKHRPNEFKRYPLVMIDEGQSNDINDLIGELVDAYKLTLCAEIRADLTPDKKIFRDIFHDYCSEEEVKGVYLRPAPWAEQFEYGLNLIRNWVAKKALVIDKNTFLAHELGRLPKDLKAYSDNPQRDFFAVNALRLVLGSFKKSPTTRDTMKDIDYGPLENYPGYYRGIDI